MTGDGWSDEDCETWANARVRQLHALTDAQVQSLLIRLVGWASVDAERRTGFADELWEVTR